MILFPSIRDRQRHYRLPMSIILDTASGATIVLTGLGIFLAVLGAKRLTKSTVKLAP